MLCNVIIEKGRCFFGRNRSFLYFIVLGIIFFAGTDMVVFQSPVFYNNRGSFIERCF